MKWEDKKNQILDYIRLQSRKEDWFLLSTQKLIEKFSNKKYKYQKIIKILDELKKEKEIVVSNLAFDVFLPKEHKKKILDKLKPFLATPRAIFYVIGFIVMILVFSVPNFLGTLFNDPAGASISAVLFGGFFIGILIIVFVAWLLQFFYNLFFKIFPTLEEYKGVIVPCTILTVICFFIILIFCWITSSSLTPALLLGILTVGILGGIALYSARRKVKSRKKKPSTRV